MCQSQFKNGIQNSRFISKNSTFLVCLNRSIVEYIAYINEITENLPCAKKKVNNSV